MRKIDWREMWLRSVIIVCLGIAGFTVCSGCSLSGPPIELYQSGNVYDSHNVGVIKNKSGDDTLYIIKIEKHYYYATKSNTVFVIGPEVPEDALKNIKEDLEF